MPIPKPVSLRLLSEIADGKEILASQVGEYACADDELSKQIHRFSTRSLFKLT